VEDKLIWQDSIDGQYKVRGGYNLLVNVTGSELNEVNLDGWNMFVENTCPAEN
jgi:hypothetical protein